MMLCMDYRRMLLADPHNPSAEMRLHVAGCPECTKYTERLLRFEGRLDRALRLNSLAPAAPRQAQPTAPLPQFGTPAARPVRRRRRWLAAAASVMVAAVVAGGLWLIAPGRSLAAAVVDHMAGEPDAWARTEVPVAETRLDAVLIQSHVRLRADAGLVSYANSCEFRGHTVPHLVLQTEGGPVTVMVLSHETVARAVHFDEQGYRGVVVPLQGHGSLAVLERGDAMNMKVVEAIAAKVQGAIDWTP
jgi:hypothetical protein